MTITKYISEDGTIAYMDSNKFLHREDGPALICNSGTQEYYFHGKHHRLDGPAMILKNNTYHWFYYGEYIPVKSQEEFLRYIKLLIFI